MTARREPPPLPGPPLRIAVLADFDGPHARRWLRVFVERGHEVHAVSFYPPSTALPGVRTHVLAKGSARTRSAAAGAARRLGRRLPRTLQRLLQAWRFRRAGLGRTLTAIAPQVFHAHYLVEHAFYGAFTGVHPYVVSAWGSDVFLETRSLPGRLLVRHAIGHADLVTAEDAAMAQRLRALGASAEHVRLIRLGLDRDFLDAPVRSVNLAGRKDAPPTVLSDRALEPLYNVDVVLGAFARLRERLPAARLVVAHDGGERPRLEALAERLGLGASVRFEGRVDPAALRHLLDAAHVYVSAPASDSLALSTMEAMAAGAFPVVSDLASQDGWIEHGATGLRVAPGDAAALAEALFTALTRPELRRDAVAPNRAKVEAEGDLEKNMLLMERYYYRLAGYPLNGESI